MIRPFLLLAALVVLLFLAGPSPAQPAPSPPPSGDEEMVQLQLLSGDVNDLLNYYQKLSGKTLIIDANLGAVQNLKIVTPGQVPKSEALRLIESVLLLNGIALVPGEDNSVKVVNAGSKNPRSEGVPIYASLDDLPQGDPLVSFFLPFRYLAISDAQQIFQAHMPDHTYGAMVPIPNAQALIITENASSIRTLVKLRDLVDVPPARVVSEFVPLQRADAERVAETLTKMIEARQSHAPAAAGSSPPPTAPGAPGNAAGGPSLLVGDVQLIPDARTNRILVVTRPSNFEYVRSLIEQFDQAVTLNSPFERPLKYVMASEVLPVLQTLLAETKDDAGSGTASATSHATPPTQPSQLSNGNAASSNTSSDSISTSRTLQENQDTAPEAVMIGKTRLIADKKANSIIVIGPPESIDKVSAILDRLDKRPMQVYLSTVIGELTLNNDSELAVDFLQRYEQTGSFGLASSQRTRSNTSGQDQPLDPRGLTGPGAFTALPTGLTLYGAASAIDYYIKALQSTGRFKEISRPVVYTQNNKGAIIASGQRIAVPTSSLSSLDTGSSSTASVVSNIDYTDVELKLEVVPLINSAREVTLQIRQTNDSVVGSQTISGNSIPTIGTQYVDTTITVPNKGTIVLGGLITQSDTTNTTGVPYLMNIPLLGYLFKGTTKDKERNELIIMIEPVVVGDEEEMADASAAEAAKSKVSPDALSFSKDAEFAPDPKKPKQDNANLPSAVSTPSPPPAPPLPQGNPNP